MMRGVQLDRWRSMVETKAPSTYRRALPRLGPFGETIPKARPVNRNVTDAPLPVA